MLSSESTGYTKSLDGFLADDCAPSLDELTDRAKVEAEIQDLLNLDRVRSLLRKVYCQRRYKEMLAEHRSAHVDTRPGTVNGSVIRASQGTDLPSM